MRFGFLALLAAAMVSSGCLVVTLQPAYDDQSLVFDEQLLGQWENADDGTRATLERGDWRSYKIAYSDRSSTRTLQGNLTKIGAATFLDVTEMRGADPGPYLVPVHGLARVVLHDDRLTVAMLDYDWFMRAATRKLLRVSTAIDDRRNVVLTGATPELRKWLATAPGDAFSPAATFARKQ